MRFYCETALKPSCSQYSWTEKGNGRERGRDREGDKTRDIKIERYRATYNEYFRYGVYVFATYSQRLPFSIISFALYCNSSVCISEFKGIVFQHISSFSLFLLLSFLSISFSFSFLSLSLYSLLPLCTLSSFSLPLDHLPPFSFGSFNASLSNYGLTFTAWRKENGFLFIIQIHV